MHAKRVAVLLWVLSLSVIASAGDVAAWDFTQGLHNWQGNSYVKDFAASPDGLAFTSTGLDPWVEGPAIDLPGSGMTRVRIRMRSDADPAGELFYGRTFEAGRSIRFSIQCDNRWHEYALVIPEPLGPQTRFRLDPATTEGRIVVASIRVETLAAFEPPQFAKPHRVARGAAEPVSTSSGELWLSQHQTGLGEFSIHVAGQEMASGYHDEQIGVLLDDRPRWLHLSQATAISRVAPGGQIVTVTSLEDDRAGRWTITRTFEPGPRPGSLSIRTTFTVDRDCEVLHLPWLTLFPGLDTFGEHKTQGLFAGLEYIDDEPSSSEADITTREHVRRVPDPVKITFPLMAIAHNGRYLGLIWEPSDLIAPTFDSPDRVYNSGAHVMALTAPAVGDRRFENAPLAHTPFVLKARQPLTARVTIIGGRGDSIVPAVRKYVENKGLPAIPQVVGGFDAAVTLLSHGWLDSAINEGGVFRHAVWGESFKAGPAGDAIMYIDWLANHAKDADLARRLIQARDLAVTRMPQGQPYMSAVSHTTVPTAPLVFGGVFPYVERRRADAESLLAHFDEQGVKLYRPRDVDYGKTHFVQHANGHAAPDIAGILEAATLSGDHNLIAQGLELLDKQTTLYANSVPRGAQVWEVPLHTPDILASAHLVKAYTLGYMISRKPEYLEQARYWAWTGVPFIYLANPTKGEVGPYATIAVLGATNWKAPVWFGQPVQWCGLVYGSALHLLSRYDPDGPWPTIAKGITAAGLQMTWPTRDEKRQGLLPDYFLLRPQISDGPAINPGTVQAHLPELFDTGRFYSPGTLQGYVPGLLDKGSLYDVRRLEKTGWFLHAPCAIRGIRETDDSLAFNVDGWGEKGFYVLLSGVERAPTATARAISQDARERTASHPVASHFDAQRRLFTIALRGSVRVELRL